MDFISSQTLPKVLEIALVELLDQQQLFQWNINSNNNITSITLKFAMPGQTGSVSTPVPVYGLRRKSPAQQRRDYSRVHMDNNSYHDYDNNVVQYQHNANYHQEKASNEPTPNEMQSHWAVPSNSNQEGEVSPSKIEVEISHVTDTMEKPEQLPKSIDPANDMDSNEIQITDIEKISQEFDKVIIDHRSVVSHNRIIGLHQSKAIAIFEINKSSEFFHIKTPDDTDYDELMTLIEGFGDTRQSYYQVWTRPTNEMYSEWNKHRHELETKTDS